MDAVDLAVEDCARICHEVNRAYCTALGDTSQKPWHEADAWQRQSAIAGVRAAIADPDATPAGMHAKWQAHKVAEGWVYGPEKNAERKEHPCLVPYDQLPAEQRAKDHIFLAIVRSMSAQAEALTRSEHGQPAAE